MNRRATFSSVALLVSLRAANAAAGTMWISPAEIAALPKTGAAWTALLAEAQLQAAAPNLADNDDRTNVRIMAKALVFAATRDDVYRHDVEAAITSIADEGIYAGRALSLGRELVAYVIAADLIDLASHDPELDTRFRAKLVELRTTPTTSGPLNLIDCHEKRPNNWGTHCGASRLAIALYLDDTADLERAATVFKGWLGDRGAYKGFEWGLKTWCVYRTKPTGINPLGGIVRDHNVDGVLPDDQRRSGEFEWPPPKSSYVYEALQGALAQAILLSRAGYDVWNWSDRALLRAFQWLYTYHFANNTHFSATGDDQWQPHVINYFYGTKLPARVPASPGKNVGWTDWTLRPASKAAAPK